MRDRQAAGYSTPSLLYNIANIEAVGSDQITMKQQNIIVVRAGLAIVLIVLLAALLPAAGGLPSVRGAVAGGREAAPLPAIAGRYVPGHVLARIPDLAAASLGGHRAEPLFGHWYKLYPPLAARSANIDSLLAAAATLPGVDVVEPNYIFTGAEYAAGAAAAPNDPEYARQWHMPQVQLEEAWGVTTGLDADTGDGVVLAVVDSGVSTGGPDGFCHELLAEYNAFTKQAGPGVAADDHGHGTHVAGTAAGCANNGVGVVGVAPDARLIAVKVLDEGNDGTLESVTTGIVWAAGLPVDGAPLNTTPAQVINLSLGTPCDDVYPACRISAVDDAIEMAVAQGAVIVASVGNRSLQYLDIPSNHPEVIAVGATRYDKQLAFYSNRGVGMGLAAPGGEPEIDQNDDGHDDGVLQENLIPGAPPDIPDVWDYTYRFGTSMASPHVAGAAALLRACVPEADRDAVRRALQESAADLGEPDYDTTYGYGFLQIADALTALATAHGRDPLNSCARFPLLLSYKADGRAGGLAFADEDVVLADPAGLSLWFDGSAYGLRKKDVDAVALLPDGTILLSISAPMKTLPGLEGITVDDSDVVRFDPATEIFSWYFDGSDMGLTNPAEDIDALALLPDGRLLFSTVGLVKTAWANGNGGDVLVYDGPLGSDTTKGTLAIFFDGSDLSMTLRKVGGVAYSPGGSLGLGYLYLVSEKNILLDGLAVRKGDVLRCELNATGPESACESVSPFWRGTDNGFPFQAALDAIEVMLP